MMSFEDLSFYLMITTIGINAIILAICIFVISLFIIQYNNNKQGDSK